MQIAVQAASYATSTGIDYKSFHRYSFYSACTLITLMPSITQSRCALQPLSVFSFSNQKILALSQLRDSCWRLAAASGPGRPGGPGGGGPFGGGLRPMGSGGLQPGGSGSSLGQPQGSGPLPGGPPQGPPRGRAPPGAPAGAGGVPCPLLPELPIGSIRWLAHRHFEYSTAFTAVSCKHGAKQFDFTRRRSESCHLEVAQLPVCRFAAGTVVHT